MSKKLKLTQRMTNETGLWLAYIGFLVALAGTALAFIALPAAGYWVGLAGALVAFLGIAMHFISNWREIFQSRK